MSEARNRLTVPVDEKMADSYENINLDTLSSMCYALLSFYLDDDIVSKYRKVLTIERYRNPKAARLYQTIFIDGVLELETDLFQKLIDRGRFINADPYIMALHFYSPVFLLLNSADKDTYDSEKLKQLINQLVYSFAEIYVKKEHPRND